MRNRDFFIRVWFIFYLTNVLNALGIDEEVQDMLPTEKITFGSVEKPKIFNHFLDFRILTKSGKIAVYEFKKNKLRKKDFKQLFDYYKPEFCKDEDNVRAIFIVISKEGIITEYKVSNIIFCPTAIKTKLINKQKDLRVIRDKFENNEILDSRECSLLIAFPLFELGESEDAIVEEMCINIAQKGDCIPDDELDGIIIGMYLNIVKYVDVEKQGHVLADTDVTFTVNGKTYTVRTDDRRYCQTDHLPLSCGHIHSYSQKPCNWSGS